MMTVFCLTEKQDKQSKVTLGNDVSTHFLLKFDSHENEMSFVSEYKFITELNQYSANTFTSMRWVEFE